VVQHSEALERESGDPALPAAVAEGRLEELDLRLRELCLYAIKLTVAPWDVVPGDIARLRDVGLDDRAIVDANQVTSYFNYVNRVADGLGVELESSWPKEAREPRTYVLRRRYFET